MGIVHLLMARPTHYLQVLRIVIVFTKIYVMNVKPRFSPANFTFSLSTFTD